MRFLLAAVVGNGRSGHSPAQCQRQKPASLGQMTLGPECLISI